MNKIYINQNQFSDLINLLNDVFFPLKNFVSKKEFLEIIKNKKFQNNFFPLPIYFGIDKKTYLKLKNKNTFDLYYGNRYLLNVYNVKFFSLDKKKYAKRFMEIIILNILIQKSLLEKTINLLVLIIKK